MKTILVATDGSENSGIALDYGIFLADTLSASLIGLYVIDIKIIEGPLFDDISGFMGLAPSQEFLTLIEKGIDERADAILHDFDKRCRAAGITPTLKKVTGIVDSMIVAEGEKADIIILAQKGEHYPLTGGGLMGSTSEAVVRKSTQPVCVTPRHYRPISHVGLGYDGSAPAEKALATAASLCQEGKWPLTVLFVTDASPAPPHLKDRVDSYLTPLDINYEIRERIGKDEEEILSFVEEDMIDLLVMGAYGHSRIREMILGSTTSYVIRRSPVPVILGR